MSDASDPYRPFSATAGRCLVAGIFAVVLNFFYPGVPLALAVNVICLWVLFRRAKDLVKDEVVGFDPLIASETMVAFGIFCLVLGLASIISRLLLGMFDFTAVQTGKSEGLLGFLPFVEGLVTAGFAPFLAVLLRITIAEGEGHIDPTGDLTELASATAALTRSMNAAGGALEIFTTGTAAAGTSTKGLATAVKTETDRWGLALAEGQAHVKSLGEAASQGRGELAGLASETHKLMSATRETATMLEELSRLIEAVERFVAPREPV